MRETDDGRTTDRPLLLHAKIFSRRTGTSLVNLLILLYSGVPGLIVMDITPHLCSVYPLYLVTSSMRAKFSGAFFHIHYL